jgi:hypothetical protein
MKLANMREQSVQHLIGYCLNAACCDQLCRRGCVDFRFDPKATEVQLT